ncbi:MAG: hypothetical protein ACUVQT_10375 [bacterium]
MKNKQIRLSGYQKEDHQGIRSSMKKNGEWEKNHRFTSMVF